MQSDPDKLRELAHWYREFAERAGSSAIWDSRLRTAEQLDAEAEAIERARSPRTCEGKVVRVVRAAVEVQSDTSLVRPR